MAVSLKAAIVISLVWHFFLCGLIEPTFDKGDELKTPQISFLGSFLPARESGAGANKEPEPIKPSYAQRISLVNLKGSEIEKIRKAHAYFSALKIPARPLFNIADLNRTEKLGYRMNLDHDFLNKYKKDSGLVFYPRLPYSFLIYFKERQKAHIEFMFFIADLEKPAFVNRKISSGNLEVDLLASRYITRHLNIIKRQFPVNTWQTVKIDLTRKNDQN